jgi:butyryl-CoA dehydrogenase
MERYFDDNHLMIRDMVREFARNEIAPVAGEMDQKSEFPWENVKKMSELGLLGVPWPEELGGAGMDGIAYMITIHELARVDASHAITVSAHTTLGTSPIMSFGTQEQKERFVPSSPAGRCWAASASPSRARGRTRGDADHRREGGRRMDPEREQDLHHARGRRRGLRGHRRHGS